MPRDRFYESESPTRWFFGIWGIIAASVVAVLLISTGLFAFGVVTAPWKGKGDAFKKQQSGLNRVFAQQQFHDLNEEYEATVIKVDLYKSVWMQAGTQQALTNYQGVQAHCLDVVADYNAASKKYLSAQFKDFDLPVVLDKDPCIGLVK